jgi:uncharacterized protein
MTHQPLADVSPGLPVADNARLSSVDTLRGVAVLGILAMNIVAFALPFAAYIDPMLPALERYQGPFEGANRLTWIISYLLFDQKMMSIFSMLFGAGLVLMGARNDAPLAGRYYRRIGVLFVIGMVHAYLLWYGDILVAYALCGALLYPLRGLRPRNLIILGVGLLLISVAINALFGGLMLLFRHAALDAQGILDAGGTLTPDQEQTLSGYTHFLESTRPSQEAVDASVASIRSGFVGAVRENAREAVVLQTFMFAIWTFWRALGLMLVGMGLMKLGVFAATRTPAFYSRLALAGIGLGLPLVAIGGWMQFHHGFDMPWHFALDGHFNYVGSILMALGYVGVVMRLCQSGTLAGLRRRLAAVGRMALTNYLMQTLLMTFIFYGWGLANYGRVERYQLSLFVVGTWAIQLVISPIWLSRFRFGPAEWVWRTLTYGRAQPMRR